MARDGHRLQVAWLNVPGRFPTVCHETGAWWDHLSQDPGIALRAVALNHAWWREICRPVGFALDRFEEAQTYVDARLYLAAVDAVQQHLEAMSQGNDVSMHFGIGPLVRGVDYRHAPALADCAAGHCCLHAQIAAVLADFVPVDLALVRVTSEYELLSALIVARLLKERGLAGHVCLLDHGYENFSLQPHLAALTRAGCVGRFFDSIVASKDEIDAVALQLVEHVRDGAAPRGVLRAQARPMALPTTFSAPALFRTFTPAPVLHLRASPRSCYWGRCTFCTQNAKFEDPRPPSKADIRACVSRVEHLAGLGIRHIILSDEAISPAFLRLLSQELTARDLSIAWACRCKLERAYDDDLLQQMARSGCREILFGLETISEPLLARMDKLVPGQGADEVAELFQRIGRAGIGLHVNLISGFPGETFEDARGTIDFVCTTLRDLPNATTLLNPFTLFPQTPIAEAPARFGLRHVWCDGDMPVYLDMRLDSETRRVTHASTAHFSDFCRDLEERLGWSHLLAQPGGRSACLLYASSGHSLVFKSTTRNALDAERRPAEGSSRARVPRRRRAFITGATGNVGRAAVEAFLSDDWDVLALVRDETVRIDGCEQIAADLHDLPDLSDVLAGMDAILHLGSPRSFDRLDMLSGEIEATGRLLDAWSTGSFVYASSQTVYGVPGDVLRESDPVQPSNWYDLAKVTVERQVEIAARDLSDAPGVSLRLPLIFDCRGSRADSQFLSTLADAIALEAPVILPDESALDRFGSVYIGRTDLGRALLAAAHMKGGGVYNIAGGFATWRDLLEAMQALLGKAPNLVFRHADVVGPQEFRLPRSRSVFDVAKFRRATGFEATTGLIEVVRLALAARLTTPWGSHTIP